MKNKKTKMKILTATLLSAVCFPIYAQGFVAGANVPPLASGATSTGTTGGLGGFVNGIAGSVGLGGGTQNNSAGQVATQGGIATSIVIPQYTAAQLAAEGCDQGVWQQMVNEYAAKAQRHVNLANKVQVQNQIQATPNMMASCYDQAAQALHTGARIYNTISSILTGGGLDSSALQDYATNLAVNYACSQVNNYLNQSGISSSINGTVGQAGGMVDGVLNGGIPVGNTNVSIGGVLNNGGFQQNTGSNIPYVSGNDIANTVGGNTGGFFNSINPFK